MTKGGRILVVDDETMVRETVGSLLVDEGYVVEQATDGADAIAKVDAHCPDVILLDLMMPGMNGRQFLDALRNKGHAVPVVVMTAVHGLIEGGGARLGATAVIEKPFDRDDLLNKIALAMYRSGGDETADIPHRPDRADDDVRVSADRTQPLPASDIERGVVLLVDRDREALLRLDALLSARGYTVVSMTRVTPELPRLARALEPRAIILDVESGEDGGTSIELVRRLRATSSLEEVPILVFTRAAEAAGMREVGDLAATHVVPVDEDLLRFVERS